MQGPIKRVRSRKTHLKERRGLEAEIQKAYAAGSTSNAELNAAFKDEKRKYEADAEKKHKEAERKLGEKQKELDEERQGRAGDADQARQNAENAQREFAGQNATLETECEKALQRERTKFDEKEKELAETRKHFGKCIQDAEQATEDAKREFTQKKDQLGRKIDELNRLLRIKTKRSNDKNEHSQMNIRLVRMLKLSLTKIMLL